MSIALTPTTMRIVRQIAPETAPFAATAIVAAALLGCQTFLHVLWTPIREETVRTVAEPRATPYLMWTLAAPIVASVLFVLFGGGIDA